MLTVLPAPGVATALSPFPPMYTIKWLSLVAAVSVPEPTERVLSAGVP